jgi:LmbE family N-acetylglucosaminyl deacetylase
MLCGSLQTGPTGKSSAGAWLLSIFGLAGSPKMYYDHSSMNASSRFAVTGLLCLSVCSLAGAQVAPSPWRKEAAGVGATTRVLIIGAHPDDEDNALIAWLSLGRHIETAYLSLTRGENGANASGREREALLGMVRTAELIAERKRDRAHQYFTRAYDFGFAKNDSVALAAWPHDSLLVDVMTVMRGFRPHVVISLFTPDSAERDGQHQVTGLLAREAVRLAGDTIRFPSARTSLLGAWKVGQFYQLADSTSVAALRINVGELDRDRGRSYAELGAEIRLLQRTQPRGPSPRIGAQYRFVRRETLGAESASGDAARNPADTSLFAGTDTGWTRFASVPVTTTARSSIDSLTAALHGTPISLVETSRDSAVARLARIVRNASRARSALGCNEPAALNCPSTLGDLAISLSTTRDRASRALLDASGIVIDVTADRETVAVGDSATVSAAVYNGGTRSVTVTRVSIDGPKTKGFAESDSTIVMPDSVARWNGFVGMLSVTYPWWLTGGLLSGSWLYDVILPRGSAVNEQLLAGEDRILPTSAFVTLQIAGAEVSTRVGPIVARGDVSLRGDDRRPLAGVQRLSVLLPRGKEYAPAATAFERLYRVQVSSALTQPDTVIVTMDLPPGIKTDSATRSVVLPPFASRTLFFRARGRWPIGEFPITASVTEATRAQAARQRPSTGTTSTSPRINTGVTTVNTGFISFEYPHIPAQRYPRTATDSVQAVDLRLPAKLRVAIIRTSRDDELESRIVELGVQAYTIDASAIGITDLSFYTAMLIAPGAYAEIDALSTNAPAVRRFAEHGGTVVVLRGRDELLGAGVLPYSVAFGTPKPITVLDPRRPVHLSNPRSAVLDWPNRITPSDFFDWTGVRARELPGSFDSHYHWAIEMDDDNGQPTEAAILSARVGNGIFIYSGLALDEQLSAANPGAARLLVNLLSAGSRKP